MLATFIIGLREGLEAALIVGIIAAFLRKNGKSLAAMWLGVGLAVALSIAVGVGLDLVEQALPQAAQEGMEAVIGALAIFFVTGMIVWMNTHARTMKKELETQAAEALSHRSASALACMAFLAVLREGFETSVFLLATFSAAQSATLAATGAVIGILIAVVIGWGIYVGGVKLNLSRFFRFTGAFLILVAAGLTITTLRSAHEAGWLNAGQQATVNLAWFVAPGTVQSALITGVLGIPADPRLIEVLGWLVYLIPVALYVYWPHAHRPSRRGAAWLQFSAALGLAIVAGLLAAMLPRSGSAMAGPASLVAEDGTQAVGTARLRRAADGSPAMLEVAVSGAAATALPLPPAADRPELHDGVSAQAWTLESTDTPAGAPNILPLDQIVTLAGGRIPVGLNPQQHPGPFAASWSTRRTIHVWAAGDVLLDATSQSNTILTLSGSGLQTPRTLLARTDNPASRNWQVAAAYRDQAAAALNTASANREEWRFWAVQLPIALCIAAGLVAAFAYRTRRRAQVIFAGHHAPISTQGSPHGAR